MKQNGDNRRENSFGGFQYRWNYDEYQKSLQRKRRKNAAHGMRAFCLTTIFVVLLCFASLMVVMTAALLRGAVGLSDQTAPLHTSGSTAIPIPKETEGDGTAADTLIPEAATAEISAQSTPVIVEAPSVMQAQTEAIPETAALSDTGNGVIADAFSAETVRDTPNVLTAMTVNEIAAACTKSTVTVHCKDDKREAVGSGFFLTEDGYLVTNYHVIRKFSAYTALLSDETSYAAELVWSDEEHDIALLKLDITNAPAVCIGSASALVIGDEVIAIGTPGAVAFAGTVTHGNVSGLDREVPIMDENDNVLAHMKMIQISAVINPGNSGGPLFNAYGEVVGINTMKMSGDGYEGMGFSIPIDTVIASLHNKIDAHRAEHVPITKEPPAPEAADTEALPDTETEALPEIREKADPGIRCEAVTEDEANLYRVPRGVLVRFIEPGSFAETSGLESGDILISAQSGDMEVTFDVFEVYLSWVDSLYLGDTVICTVFRAGETVSVTLSFAEPLITEADAA